MYHGSTLSLAALQNTSATHGSILPCDTECRLPFLQTAPSHNPQNASQDAPSHSGSSMNGYAPLAVHRTPQKISKSFLDSENMHSNQNDNPPSGGDPTPANPSKNPHNGMRLAGTKSSMTPRFRRPAFLDRMSYQEEHAWFMKFMTRDGPKPGSIPETNPSA